MIFALVLLYQTATVGTSADPPKADVSQTQAQTTAASGAAAGKPSEKPDVVCHKEFLTGTRVRTAMVCTSSKSMERSQADFSKSLGSAPLAPRP
jgi:hypothetical protein